MEKELEIIDCDVHVRWQAAEELAPYLAEPFRSYLRAGRRPYIYNGYFSPIGVRRRDALPPAGGSPGSDPQFTITDHVQRYDLAYAVLMGESSQLGLANMPDPYWAQALARAYNDWLINRWFAADQRYLGSIYVATQEPQEAAREIERVGSHPQFVQVVLGAGARAPYGQRFYHPIYEAAQRHDLAIGIHVGSDGAGTAASPTGAGYPSTYLEWHTLLSSAMSAHLVSFICEGVFERFPRLRLVLIEAGVSWFPGLMWRLDRDWRGLRRETPWLKRRPSEYAREHVRLTTQPLEEPENPQHLHQLLQMFPAEEMLLFASDYPHWDFDAPATSLAALPAHMRARIFGQNARELYNLPQ
jgi:uncharacterized protein